MRLGGLGRDDDVRAVPRRAKRDGLADPRLAPVMNRVFPLSDVMTKDEPSEVKTRSEPYSPHPRPRLTSSNPT